jgi:hypothetical protein
MKQMAGNGDHVLQHLLEVNGLPGLLPFFLPGPPQPSLPEEESKVPAATQNQNPWSIHKLLEQNGGSGEADLSYLQRGMTAGAGMTKEEGKRIFSALQLAWQTQQEHAPRAISEHLLSFMAKLPSSFTAQSVSQLAIIDSTPLLWLRAFPMLVVGTRTTQAETMGRTSWCEAIKEVYLECRLCQLLRQLALSLPSLAFYEKQALIDQWKQSLLSPFLRRLAALVR